MKGERGTSSYRAHGYVKTRGTPSYGYVIVKSERGTPSYGAGVREQREGWTSSYARGGYTNATAIAITGRARAHMSILP